ncbi:MAG: tetratricopeptide repeat protein [Saprospiraceae bacterium]|nr:tetratricopeptide repeat protein [Saprospiraceae bacterium]
MVKYLIPTHIQTQYLNASTYGEQSGFVMFVDLSGFTPLTEALMQQGKSGAEEMSLILNKIFEPLVHCVYQYGGMIPYFAGDSFTALFPQSHIDQKTAQEFISISLLMSKVFGESNIYNSRFGEFEISIKMGLACGDWEWGIVGKEIHSYYYKGQAIFDAANAQSLASAKEIILHRKLAQYFSSTSALPLAPIQGEEYFKLGENATSALSTEIQFFKRVAQDTIKKKVALKFLPEGVIDMQESGEFRNVISIFLSFENVDSYAQLNNFASVVLEQTHTFQGYFKEIDFGDKGGVMLVLFGAPTSYEQMEDRALEFAISVMHYANEHSILLKIGISQGIAFTGIIGSDQKHQYAAVGNRVNLSARLLTNAKWSEVLCDEIIARNEKYTFEKKGNVKYKGIKREVPTYSLIGKDEFAETNSYSGEMVGREDELDLLVNTTEHIISKNESGLLTIFGEAGIGKSRLAFEFKKKIISLHSHVEWCNCPTDQILRKPLNPFIHFLRNHFKLNPHINQIAAQTQFSAQWQQWLDQYPDTEDTISIKAELNRTSSFLAALIGVQFQNSLWENSDAQRRYENTLTGLVHFFKLISTSKPVIIEIEDGHWLDETSIEFLKIISKEIQNQSIIFLFTCRYNDDGEAVLPYLEEVGRDSGKYPLTIDLNIFSHKGIKSLAEQKLGYPISDELHEVLIRTSNGNPFYVEQVLEYFQESKILQFSAQHIFTINDAKVKISDSIQTILMARIDRLSILVKETVKAAAVIGREFDVPVLNEVMINQEEFLKKNGDSQKLLIEQIHTAEKAHIWQAMNELRYIFKHSLLREAVYEMQLISKLKKLHQFIAEAFEKLYVDSLENRYVELAYHFGQAENQPKTKHYLKLAASTAFRNFQNQQALQFYDQLLELYRQDNEVSNQVAILLKIGRILEVTGDWTQWQQRLEEAQSLQTDLKNILEARVYHQLGKLSMLKGNYDEAKVHLEKSAAYFDVNNDIIGRSKIYGELGSWHFRKGNYDRAKDYFTQSIQLSESANLTPDAQIVALLGLTFMNQADYEEGIQCQLKHLVTSRAKSDKQGEAILNVHLGIVYFEKGDYESALACHEEGMILSKELGHQQLLSIVLGCIGSVYEKKGQYEKAMDFFIQDLNICNRLGDKQGIAIVLGLIGYLYSIQGDLEKATQYLDENLSMCQNLGYQKGIAKALNNLADVYMTKGDSSKAIHYYDEAIIVTKRMNNKALLGFNLVEKSKVLLHINHIEEAEKVFQEAFAIGHDLDNAELSIELLLMGARIANANANKAQAMEYLEKLRPKVKSNREEAALYYEWSKIEPSNDGIRNKAIDMYKQLFQNAPRFIYQERIKELQVDAAKC